MGNISLLVCVCACMRAVGAYKLLSASNVTVVLSSCDVNPYYVPVTATVCVPEEPL